MPEKTPSICSLEGCDSALDSRGLCRHHYKKLRRHGDPLWTKPSAEERFEMRVERTETGCWLWTGNLHILGYGDFWNQGTSVLAHRFAYEAANGPIPDGLDIDHTCHNNSGCAGGKCDHRRCVNPAHLEAVSPVENRLRSHLFGSNKTACKWGHPYTPENTYLGPTGGRRCRTCARERDMRRAS